MARKVMRLLDRSSGLMECKVCGERHFANIRPDSRGHYYRGSWQCGNGCKLPLTPAELARDAEERLRILDSILHKMQKLLWPRPSHRNVVKP